MPNSPNLTQLAVVAGGVSVETDRVVPAEMQCTPRSFAEKLFRGEATGYSVCAKPLRFASLSDALVTSYAEKAGAQGAGRPEYEI